MLRIEQSHHNHPIYANNRGTVALQSPLPLPSKNGLPIPIKSNIDVDEPKFNPKIHLNLGMPEFVRIFPEFDEAPCTPPFQGNSEGSLFAYSSPFQVFSKEGVEVLNDIINREEHEACPPESHRGNKMSLRGLYYFSPFVRDLQQCQELRNLFCKIAGEELIPHPSLSNSPQVNLSIANSTGPVDDWHYDSIAYTGVVLLNDVRSMDGGKLEIMHHNKFVGLEKLANKEKYKSEAISYESAGKMILAQGSEILHHVTPVTSNTKRISLVFGYAPANAFQPPKTILRPLASVDTKLRMAKYEFFREKAWQTMTCLKHYVEKTTYSNNGKELGDKLKSVAEELARAGDILTGTLDDSISIYNEKSGQLVEKYNTKNLYDLPQIN